VLERSWRNSPRSFKPSVAVSEDSAEAYEGRLLSVVQNILDESGVAVVDVSSGVPESWPRSEVKVDFHNCCLAGNWLIVDAAWSHGIYICCYRSGVS